jgi:hypothetical protein
VLNDPSYNYQRWHGTLILYAVVLVTVFVNTIAIRMLPALEGVLNPGYKLYDEDRC